MGRQLERVGLFDNPSSRDYVAEHFEAVLNDSSNIARIQASGREVRESFLMGPRGGVKVESVWEGPKLITVILCGGGQ